ncbi:hypothetical protein V6N13_001191 [Hibiscus sabdariffa]
MTIELGSLKESWGINGLMLVLLEQAPIEVPASSDKVCFLTKSPATSLVHLITKKIISLDIYGTPVLGTIAVDVHSQD